MFKIQEPAAIIWHSVAGRRGAKPVYVQSVHVVILQRGTNELSLLPPLLVGSDPEGFVHLLHASYGVHFVVFAKLFVVVRRCRSTSTLQF